MDSAAIHLAVDPSSPQKTSARLCLRMGFTALSQIAETMRVEYDRDPDPDAPISVTREEFGEAMAMLRNVGYPRQRSDADCAWRLLSRHGAKGE